MKKHLQTVGAAVALIVVLGATAGAQDKPAAAAKEIVPLKVQIILSRHVGEKKVSSLPYTLSVNANELDHMMYPRASSLRMGAQIPVASVKPPVVGGQEMPMPQSFQYKDVGTNIDCSAVSMPDGRFRVSVTIDDTSVIGEEANVQAGLAKGNPSFRSFRANESLLLRDGQSLQFTTATDKVTGDVVKADVTLTVVK